MAPSWPRGLVRSLHWISLSVWLLYFVVVASLVARPGKAGLLYPTFVTAGGDFRRGEPLYKTPIPDGLDQFRYTPAIAALCAPWEFVPRPYGDWLWRAGQVVLLLLATRFAGRSLVPRVPWPLLSLALFPIAAGNVNNGQLNPLVLAACLFGWAAFARSWWWYAAAAVALATLVKLYPLALGLLLVLLAPRPFGPRLLVMLILGLALPYCLQSPEYVTQQYREWVQRLGGDDRSGFPLYSGYQDFHAVLRALGLAVPLSLYRVLEAVAGGLIAARTVMQLRRGTQRELILQDLLLLAMGWMTVFGPATETSTYILFGFSAAYVLHATRAAGGRWEYALAILGYCLLLSVPVSLWFGTQVSNPWRSWIPQAWGTLCITLAWFGGSARLAPNSPQERQR